MRFWLSWYQPTQDERPLTFPPNKAIIGWWNSGSRCDDGAHTLCALVEAKTEKAAKAAIKKDWPEATEYRFAKEKATDWLPGDRFPLSDWMQARVKGAGQ